MPYVIENAEELHVVYHTHGLVKLPQLPEGSHSLTVYLEAYGLVAHKSSYADTVNFAVDTTPPNVSILSPVNKTYTSANITTAKIPLDFTFSENVSQVAFNLDCEEVTSIAGNTTLTGLSIGPHNVTVYAQDLAGNAASETVNFVMAAEPEPQPELEAFQPTTLVAVASGASTAIIGIALLLTSRNANVKQRTWLPFVLALHVCSSVLAYLVELLVVEFVQRLIIRQRNEVAHQRGKPVFLRLQIVPAH